LDFELTLALDKLPKLTYRVELPGGQTRLREAILYICQKCSDAPHFGLTKLNKMLWLADFTSFAERAQPVTGRTYQRLDSGPAPVEMLPLLNDMLRNQEIAIDDARVLTFDERRPRALVSPTTRNFSSSDLSYLDMAIQRYWNLTGRDVSDKSHGVAWKTRKNGDPMPYESAYFDDDPLGVIAKSKLERVAKARGLKSL
jgi:hypothetical protein